MDNRKRIQREADYKSAETKGPDKLSRAEKEAAWTRKHGKDDALDPYSKANVNPGQS